MAITTLRCQTDANIDSALLSYQEEIGDQVRQLREALSAVRVAADSVDAGFSGPLRSSLDAMLAPVGVSLDEFLDLTGIPVGDSRDDLERSFDERYGLTVVGGRLIIDGEVDVSNIQAMARMLGGLDNIYSRFPYLLSLPIEDDSDSGYYAEAPALPVQVLVVFSRFVDKLVPGSTSDTFRDEEILGVDVPLSSVLSMEGVTSEEVVSNVFWMGTPSPLSSVRRRMMSFGFTNSQFVDAVALSSSSGFVVRSIDTPADIPRLSVAFGDEADAILQRVTRPIAMLTDPLDSAVALRDFIKRSTSGGAGPSGVRDFSSPSMFLMSVLDVDKTFDALSLAESLGANPPDPSNTAAVQYAEGVSKSMVASLTASSVMFSEFQAASAVPLTNMLAVQSATDAILNDASGRMANCLFGSSFSPSFSFSSPSATPPSLGLPGTPGVPGFSTSNPIEAALSTIEDSTDLALSFLSGVSGAAGALQGMSCTSSFLAGASSLTPSMPGVIPCVADRQADAGFALPSLYEASVGVTKVVIDTISDITSSFRSNIRMLKMHMVSTRLSIRDTVFSRGAGDISVPGLPAVPPIPGFPSPPSLPGAGSFPGVGCASPAVSQLAALLQARSLAGFTAP